MSDTPRTDAWANGPISDMVREDLEFTRTLERELGAARDQLAAVTRERDEWKNNALVTGGMLRAEVERLRALLREWTLTLPSTPEDALDRLQRTQSALGEGE